MFEETFEGDHWVVAADGGVAHDWCERYAVRYGFEVIGSGKRLGVAGNKNRILSYFLQSHHDHLFLFEDDCYPIKRGWEDLYFEAHRLSGSGCLLFLPVGMYGKVVWSQPARKVHGLERDGGMLLSLTRRAVEVCGGLHPAFRIYGGEHSEYARRLVRNGQMVYTRACPVGCEEFIDGWDYANYQGRVGRIRMDPFTSDVEKIKDSSLRGHAKQGLLIYEQVKDKGGCFQDPGDWRR
jgi:hypothetical protein